jgi:hypothetical protein
MNEKLWKFCHEEIVKRDVGCGRILIAPGKYSDPTTRKGSI